MKYMLGALAALKNNIMITLITTEICLVATSIENVLHLMDSLIMMRMTLNLLRRNVKIVYVKNVAVYVIHVLKNARVKILFLRSVVADKRY